MCHDVQHMLEVGARQVQSRGQARGGNYLNRMREVLLAAGETISDR